MKQLVWLFLLWLSPVVASAAVSISEIAWMGSSASANYEWIELYNDGNAVDVTGWTVTDGMNLDIELTGVIPANTRVVLERTSDVSAPGTAFLIYTGALVNTGATLRLKRSDGSLADQVSGGEDWQNIGGDNNTKETAQYTTKGWVTGVATPGAPPNETIDTQNQSDKDNDNESSKKTTSVTKNKSEPVVLTVPDVTLALAIEAQTIGYVHQPITFSVEPSGIGASLINSLSYQWNFGDGSVSTTKEPTHVFLYPGTYVVTVYVSLTTSPEGAVQINNDSPYEIDVSGYRLQGEDSFRFPPYSILLPNQTVTIAPNKIGDTKNYMVVLYDTEQVALASLFPRQIQTATVAMAESKPPVAVQNYAGRTISAPNASFTFATNAPAVIPAIIDSAPTSTELLAGTMTSAGAADSRFAYLALVGVLSLSVLGIYASPRRNETEPNLVV